MKSVVVTGASAGVGAATARLFAERGHKVILLARSAEKLHQLVDQLGDNAFAVPCDAADGDAVAAAAAAILTDHCVPDLIINCAGMGAWKTVTNTTPQEAREMMGAPYFAAFNVTQAFLQQMIDRKAGVIISVNSPACVVTWPSSAGYAAARGALRSFHEAMGQDLVGTGVHACHVIFGRIDTGYFETNTVDPAQLPTLDRFMRVLSSQDCAAELYKLAQHPRSSLIRPRLLSLVCAFARIFPRTGRWVARL